MSDLITPKVAGEMRASLEELSLTAIRLTQDPALQQKLRNKLEEYRGRVSRKEEGLRAICKAAIMAVLVKTGSVTPDLALAYLASNYLPQASSELQCLTQSGMSSLEAFEELKKAFDRAWRVIQDYNKTGGRHTRGGTGLKLGGIDPTVPLPVQQ